jgi:hypothetical protein
MGPECYQVWKVVTMLDLMKVESKTGPYIKAEKMQKSKVSLTDWV